MWDDLVPTKEWLHIYVPEVRRNYTIGVLQKAFSLKNYREMIHENDCSPKFKETLSLR